MDGVGSNGVALLALGGVRDPPLSLTGLRVCASAQQVELQLDSSPPVPFPLAQDQRVTEPGFTLISD